MKRLISLCLLLCILAAALVCAPVTASASTTVSNIKAKYSKGFTTVSWSSSGDEIRYKVLAKVVNNGQSKQAWLSLGTTKTHSISTQYLIPEKTYEFAVCTEDGIILDSREISLPYVDYYVDGKLKPSSVKMTIKPRRAKYGATSVSTEIKQFTASAIMSNLKKKKYDYGLYIKLKMPQFKKDRKVQLTIAYQSPEGFLWPAGYGRCEFKRYAYGYYIYSWNFIGRDFFRALYNTTGDIQTGVYKMYMYWDGKLMKTGTFRVN